jgi:hypothetical protein
MRHPVRISAGRNTAFLLFCSVVLTAAILLSSPPGFAQFSSYQKIGENSGGYSGSIEPGDDFGESACVLGDVDGDSVTDIAIGAEEDDDGGLNRGAVWVLFLNPDGTVKDHQKISSTEGGFTGRISDGNRFGDKCAGLGDLDRDGVPDIAIGQQGGTRTRVVFLRTDGTVKSHRDLACGDGGRKIANIGDFDGDGVIDLAAGSPKQSTLGPQRGAFYICLLGRDGRIKSTYEISEVSGGFTGTLDDGDLFGNDIAGIGDLDDNGVVDIAVNAKRDDDGGTDIGAVWLMFMNADGTVKRHQKISQTEGGFQDSLPWYASFGEGVTGLGDVDGDGVEDMAVGADYADVGGRNRGAVWLLFLNPDGTIKAQDRIASDTPGFEGALQDSDNFGRDLANLGDLDGDGVTDLLVSADADSNESPTRDSAYTFFLEGGIRTSGFDLLVSNFADRWGAEPLHQSTVSGPVYVFVDPAAPVNQIDFYIDDVFVRTDGLTPYDLEGGSVAIANPFDAATLTNGLHTFKALSLLTTGGLRTSWASVTVNNSILNQPPLFTPIGPQSVAEGQELAFTVSASDPDPGDMVSLSASGLPAGATFLDNGDGSGEFFWTPATGAAANSPYTVSFTATDPLGQQGVETIQITSAPADVVDSTEPLGLLVVDPENPRYFRNSSTGKTVQLIGPHTWWNLQNTDQQFPPAPFDYNQHIAWLRANGYNHTRLWHFESVYWYSGGTTRHYISPQVYQRTGPGLAHDGRPKFDVTQLNQRYFDRLRARVVSARNNGVYVTVMFFQGVASTDRAVEWAGHPFNANNNVNGIDGDLNQNGAGSEVHTLRNSAVVAAQRLYIRKVIDTIGDLDNVIWEIGNEIYPGPDQIEWAYDTIRYIRNYEAAKAKQHPIGLSYMHSFNDGGEWTVADKATMFGSPADWISVGQGSDWEDYRYDPPPANGAKVIISDVDHLWGTFSDDELVDARGWLWKSATMSLHTITMEYGEPSDYPAAQFRSNGRTQVTPVVRAAMSALRGFLDRLDLSKMRPRSDLSSLSHCLAEERQQYLIYKPDADTESFTVDGLTPSARYRYEWFDTVANVTRGAGTLVPARSRQTFTPPTGYAALYLVRVE